MRGKTLHACSKRRCRTGGLPPCRESPIKQPHPQCEACKASCKRLFICWGSIEKCHFNRSGVLFDTTSGTSMWQRRLCISLTWHWKIPDKPASKIQTTSDSDSWLTRSLWLTTMQQYAALRYFTKHTCSLRYCKSTFNQGLVAKLLTGGRDVFGLARLLDVNEWDFLMCLGGWITQSMMHKCW